MQKSRSRRKSWLAAELVSLSHDMAWRSLSLVFLFISFYNWNTLTSPEQSDISGEWQATTA